MSKPVTVVFADLAGSTELATRHDPEHLRALLSAFFEEVRQRIEAFGGTVEKYAGDAIVAVFGVPRVNEDDAERAVRAAMAMTDSLAQLNPLFEQAQGMGGCGGRAVLLQRLVARAGHGGREKPADRVGDRGAYCHRLRLGVARAGTPRPGPATHQPLPGLG